MTISNSTFHKILGFVFESEENGKGQEWENLKDNTG